jgi:hypothetical protein
MASIFGKKKEESPNNGQTNKNSSLGSLESELTVLNKSDLAKVEGGKETKKPLNDNTNGFRDIMGGSIPL